MRGRKSPFSLVNSQMDIKQTVTDLAISCLDTDSIFLVDVKVSPADKGLIRVLLDGDNGVTIEDCSKLSRKLGNILEEEDLIEGSYTLEVSSAGVGQPLMMLRQYKKNVDRLLKVTTKEGQTIKGVLKEVTETGITLDTSKKKNKGTEETKSLIFDDINKAIVEISF